MNVLASLAPAPPGAIQYPDDDGKPLANNSEQGKWIVVLYGNLCALLREVLDVYLAVDHLWYPEVGHPEIRNAPDVMVVFGRPKRGKRGSYKQWEEDNIPVTVAFEILSPGNDPFEMADKLAFYDEFGVEEYYLYDPEQNRLAVSLRKGQVLRRVWQTHGFVSPRLGIRFDLSGPEMVVFYPDGRRFLTFEELEGERVLAEQRAKDAEQRAEIAEQRAEHTQERAEKAEQRVEDVQRRAARQADLMRRALRQQATTDELQELHQLLEQTPLAP